MEWKKKKEHWLSRTNIRKHLLTGAWSSRWLDEVLGFGKEPLEPLFYIMYNLYTLVRPIVNKGYSKLYFCLVIIILSGYKWMESPDIQIIDGSTGNRKFDKLPALNPI